MPIINELLFSNEYYDNTKNTLKNIYNEFQENEFMCKEELLEFLPRYLNKPGTTKASYIASLSDEVSEDDFVDLLKIQTLGMDYPSFDYLVLKYDLEFDNNHMIIFTDEFKFDNKIKKEALFIWGILNALSNHELLWPYISIYDLQASYETEDVHNSRKKRYDMEFSELQFVIEIDENHRGETTLANDEFKNVLASMNGRMLIRLNFQEIYKDEGVEKGKGEILAGENANDYMYNSEYYKKFLELLYDSLINSLLNNNAEFRQKYIFHLFNESLKNQLIILKSSIRSNKKRISNIKKKISTADSKTIREEYNKKIVDMQLIQDKNRVSIDKIKFIIEFIKSDQSFLKLFGIKDKYKPKFIGDKNIPFTEILDVLHIVDEAAILRLKHFMYTNHIISKYYRSNNDIYVSWKELSIIITEFDSDSELGKVLILYYFELEESYESIIARMLSHSKKIASNEEKYNECMRNENKKISIPLEKLISEKDVKILELSEQLAQTKLKLENLSSDIKYLNISYNKALKGEFMHERSPINIRFNRDRLFNA